MTETILERLLQQVVNEQDNERRRVLANHYMDQLSTTLRTISNRAHTTLWSEKEDILAQVMDTNALVKALLDRFDNHESDSHTYRSDIAIQLRTLHEEISRYIAQIPMEERLRLIDQLADHEQRITQLEQQSDGDKP